MNAVGPESGFNGLWNVYSDYEIKNGELIAGGEVREKYLPIDRRELPSVISKLNPESEEDILDFARVYGTFGYGGVLEDTDEQDKWRKRDSFGWMNRDPLWWIREEIKTIKLVSEFLQCSLDQDEQKAEELFNAHLIDRIEGIGGTTPLRTPSVTFIVRNERVMVGANLNVTTPLEWVTHMACDILNRNSGGVHRFITTEGGKFKSYFYPDALVDVVYWQLNDAAEGGVLKRCTACQTPFISTDGRQKFCPPKNKEDQSRCGLLFRQRERRKKQ